MKRLIYFLLLVGGMGATSYFLLFSNEIEYLKLLEEVFNLVRSGDWDWATFNVFTIHVYGISLFFFIVGVLFLALLIMALTTLFRFDRVHRFYATAVWYLIAALIFTGTIIYTLTQSSMEFMDALSEMPWEYYVPIV